MTKFNIGDKVMAQRPYTSPFIGIITAIELNGLDYPTIAVRGDRWDYPTVTEGDPVITVSEKWVFPYRASEVEEQ